MVLLNLRCVSLAFVIAAAGVVVATVPTPGDVCFTSRSVHSAPVGDPNTVPKLTTDEAAAAFHATRLDWVYTTDAAFVANASANGLPVTAAINANVPDKLTGPATYKIGRIVNLTGSPLTAPWMWGFSKTNPPYYGCVNNPEYTDGVLFPRALALLKMGASGLQHDDPHVNAEAVHWKHGGCYCDHCMAKFTTYASERGLLPHGENATTFDYKQYLLERGGYGRGDTTLRVGFEAFQFDSAVAYQRRLRAYLDAEMGRPVAMSCNNGATLWDNVTSVFDFGMGELAHADCTPDRLRSLLLEEPVGNVPRGKTQVVTMPKLREYPLGTPIKLLTRKAAVLTSLLAGHMLVPWDIYMPAANMPATRFYGNVSDFVDVFAWIAARGAATVGAFPALLHTWGAGPSVVRFDVDGGNGGGAPDADVYWVLRGMHESAAQREWVIGAVDWAWPRGDSAVVWPLPTNPGTNFTVAFNVSSVVPDAATFTLAPPLSVNVSVVLKDGDVVLPEVTYSGAIVRFAAPATVCGFAPFAVFRIALRWE